MYIKLKPTGLSLKKDDRRFPFCSRLPAKNRCSGFTLFEILIALFIFSVVVTTIFGSYRLIISSAEAVEKGISVYEMGNTCLNRMVLDLQSIYVAQTPGYRKPEFNDPPSPQRIVGDAVYTGTATFPRLRFSSHAHVALGKNRQEGIAEIVYYVEPSEEEDGVYTLKRADHLPPYPEFEPDAGDPILCEGLRNLTIVYFDEEGTEYETWNSESVEFRYATPRAAKITLAIGDADSVAFTLETVVEFPVYREQIK